MDFVHIPKKKESSPFITPKKIELGPHMTTTWFDIEIKPLQQQILQKLSDFLRVRKRDPQILILWEFYYKALETAVPGFLHNLWWAQSSNFEIKQTIIENIVEVY